ncbi:protein phosphatase CheZ [Azospirillum brasilense]|uniref:protein phosphatase CheZ n=1 Tax=Azospirillum brasilense TaxID=192 RepID=UPI001EDAB0AB|nr:protein phosphatase CheZ [Azospirillum brasilense]UKJ74137.1 hypothetical protein H1Q64_06010 [Azospirillum brasilense]
MSDVPLMELTEHDYLQMEEALSQTARGRAFLRMRDRRSRVVAVDEFHRLTGALEQQVNRLRGVDPGALPRPVPGGGVGQGLGDGLQLQQELMSITQVVRETRSDIAALRPADTGSNRIEAATGELDEIVAATERATTDILNATEKIQEITQGIPRTDPDIAEMVDAIDAWSIEIMTACAFQDITGQRTTKVVNTLRYIEQRVNTMIEIWGVDRIATASETASMGEGASHRKLGDTRPDAHLLNGPQLGGPEVSQDDIDALFDTLATQIPQVLERAEPAEAPAPPPPPPSPPPAAAKPAPRPAAPAPEPSGGGSEISQADIDALFA